MKNTYFLIMFCICITFVSCAQSNKPSSQQLMGTWYTSYTIGSNYGYGTTTNFYFTLYEDFRSYSVSQYGFISNGTWGVEDDIFFSRKIGDYTTTKLQTLQFDGQNWTYRGLGDNITYHARRVSSTPKVIPLVDYAGNIKNLDAPRSNIIDLSQISGTWKAKSNKDGSEYHFTIYPDQRIYSVNTEGVTGAWTITGDKFFFYVDYLPQPYISKTISFSKTAWNYQSLEDGTNYVATKISDIPQILKPKKVAVTTNPKSENTNTSNRSRYSPKSFSCVGCNGTCQMNCEICYGQGRIKERVSRSVYNYNTDRHDIVYEDEWRNCTAMGCNNGKTKCTYCNCKSADLDDIILHGTDKVPYDEDVFGSWKTALGEVYTFYNTTTSGGYLLKYSVGSTHYVGAWEIEDSLLKMFLHQGLDPQWQKYAFKSFDSKTMHLKKASSLIEEIHLTKIK